FTHPSYFSQLKAGLEFDEQTGFYKFQNYSTLFVPTVEVATFYNDGKKSSRVHQVIHAPSLEVCEQISEVLSKRGNLSADGRPMFAKTSLAEMVELILGVSKDCFIYPAHAWTSWFGVFGSKTGFDSLKQAYEDQYKNIFAIETGLSSDPQMNARCSFLDNIALLSNSDAHSPHPWRLGRECNAFNLRDFSYKGLHKVLKENDKTQFLYTVEVDPAYGKYHFDGHRACSFSCSPEQSRKLNGICPVCKKELTIGVEYRVEELADRPKDAKSLASFKRVLPLHELISALIGSPLSSPKVRAIADNLMPAGATELSVLLDEPKDELLKRADAKVVNVILANREGRIKVKPGFDGEYGVLDLKEFKNKALDKMQKSLGEY
ncbi:DNA helicase UvrD, partial [Candidatus Micrarchaeota archaeon]|nr:DNA helicase UvrD [Candidatus Micrarchaeota archaeon]